MAKWCIVTTPRDHIVETFLDDGFDGEVTRHLYESDVFPEKEPFDVVYFRDPFNVGVFDLAQIDSVVKHITEMYPSAYFVDGIRTTEGLLFEDKWTQYEMLSDFMPFTRLPSVAADMRTGELAKKRISSRARDIVFDKQQLTGPVEDYIFQQGLDILTEYRVIAVGGAILPKVAVRSSKTASSRVRISMLIDTDPHLLSFATKIMKTLPGFDLAGLDIALTTNGYRLIEVNRSPQFKRYQELGDISVVRLLHDAITKRRLLTY